MENETNLGNPIPTGVITPTEILPPVEPAIDDLKVDAVQPDVLSPPVQVPAEAPMNFLAEMMFAPIVFWASLSASYFRFFDLTARNASTSYRIG